MDELKLGRLLARLYSSPAWGSWSTDQRWNAKQAVLSYCNEQE